MLQRGECLAVSWEETRTSLQSEMRRNQVKIHTNKRNTHETHTTGS